MLSRAGSRFSSTILFSQRSLLLASTTPRRAALSTIITSPRRVEFVPNTQCLSRSWSSSGRTFSDAKTEGTAGDANPTEGSETNAAAGTAGTAEEGGDSSAATIAKLQKEVKELKDAVLRAYADEENTRRIAKRDVANATAFANEKFAKALLDVADNLERALSAIPADKRTSIEDPAFKTLVEGIEMTEKQMQKVFQQFHVIKYGVVGEAFNPAFHDALFNIPDTTKEANTLGQVLKTGYKLKDRVIRAAQVGTIIHP